MLLALFFSFASYALEIQGFVTKDCAKVAGIIVYATDSEIEIVNLKGQLQKIDVHDISSLVAFDVLDNPIGTFQIDDKLKERLKLLYIEDQKGVPVFAIRFIEDLLLFMTLDGKVQVHSFSDIQKLRPATENVEPHRRFSKNPNFDFSGASASCSFDSDNGIKPTRIMTDQISIGEFINDFARGYEGLESFEERTYLYSRPYLFERHARFGLSVVSSRTEPAIEAPVFFQFSSGEPYRFQSFTAFGMISQEFLPNSEPTFSLRSEVKSHLFHALFAANVLGIPAGTSIFLKHPSEMKLEKDVNVQPSFNYLAMMGADYGPYSLSVGLYYPTFGIKVGNEYREVLGSSVSYAVRAMYTTSILRLRAITAFVRYDQSKSSSSDVLSKTGEDGNLGTPTSFQFQSIFFRGGADYQYSDRLRFSADAIIVEGSYKEQMSGLGNDIRFNKVTAQFTAKQSFSDYLAVSLSANLLYHDFNSNFVNVSLKDDKQESNFFASFEFIF